MAIKAMSWVTLLVVIGNLMLPINPHSFPSNLIKVALYLSNFDQLILIALKAYQNIIFAKLLSTISLRIVKFLMFNAMSSTSS